ncbi:Cyclic nucleotide-binding protein [Pseudocohnilembus persalinus]|uniref:Cyclic nucleotide-binding protein n=1 Tax=Pseudocohnilembus persalinus TaxID=266149 RepID=A0A0V0QRJ2_PSEPJ|nr:Cyclic nucleotide-binding protein [Pseudocohnilembus persalinus]|eukprot:KRX04781.1 Cyclic nucleotide-binding protein [Pseudocohnilembus persalinus]
MSQLQRKYNIQDQMLQGQQQQETKKLGDKFIFKKSEQYLDNNLIEQALKNQSLKFNINQGHPFGEISALTSKPRTGTVVCNSECYFLEIEPEQFRRDVAKSIFLIKEGEVEIVETSKQIEQEISQKNNEKNTKNNDNILISQFLSRNNDDFQQISGIQGLRKFKKQNTWLKQKKEQTILILGDNSYFGDEELVLKKSQRVYTARSRSHTTIYEIDLARYLMSLLEKRSLMKENQKQTRLNQICLGNMIQHDLKSKENNQIRISQSNTVKKQQLQQIQSSKERELSKINTLQSSNNQLTKYSDDSLELINNTKLDETAHNNLIKNYKKKEENQDFKNNQINMYVQQLRDKKHNINKKKTAFIGNHHDGIVQTTGSKKQTHIIKNYDEVDFSNSKGSNEDNSSNKYSSLSKQNKYKEDSQSSYKKLKDITQSQELLKYYKQDEILQKNQGFKRMRTLNGQFITNFESIENLQNQRDQKSASPGVNFRHYKRSQFKHLSTQPTLHNKLVKKDSVQNQQQKNDNQNQQSKQSIKPIQIENNNNIKNNNNQKQVKRQSQFIQQNVKGYKQSIAVNVNESLLSESQNNTKLKQLLRYQGFTNKVFNQSQNSGLNLNQDLQNLQNSINLQQNNSLIFNNVRKSSRISIDKNFNLGKSVKQSQNLSNSRKSSNLDYNQSKNLYLKQNQTSQTSIKDSDNQYNQQNLNNINMDYSINVNIINSSKRLNNKNDNNQNFNGIQSNRVSSLNQISICKSQLTISPQNSPLKRGSNQKLDNTHKNSSYNEVFSADSIQQQDMDIEILKNQAEIKKNSGGLKN